MSDFKIVNLCDYLNEYTEEGIQEFLSSYSCPPNKDIEIFLRERAISFSTSSSARTFLISTRDTNLLVGYFTLAPKSLVLEEFAGVSKSLEKKIKWFSDAYLIGHGKDEHTIQVASVILIAHLGKNYKDCRNELITGKQLLEIAFEKIVDIQHELGGRFVLVECEDKSHLIDFYTANGFRKLQNRPINEGENDYFVQLVRTS